MRRFATAASFYTDILGAIGMDRMVSTPEDTRKLNHLVAMEGALRSLRGQMSAAKEAQNVAMRRGFMRSSGTEDLVQQFWGSESHDWSARPSTYIALLDELEERGFFDIEPPMPPDPAPLTPASSKRSSRAPRKTRG
ncbi:MAG: hypothetical protein AAB839_00155 [Patescibacteria group bacterium]